jgi:hypothetical protein
VSHGKGERLMPERLFRFGRVIEGRPVIEFWQRDTDFGMQALSAGETEASLRAFLLGLDFVEVCRYSPGGNWSWCRSPRSFVYRRRQLLGARGVLPP